jgi:predicted acylesterase/phospholipase RssA
MSEEPRADRFAASDTGGGIAVALSGGGHRAALFGLGVLMYLVDAGVNAKVSSVSSVSGGSLTNGYVAQAVDYGSSTPESFRPVAARVSGQIARGTLWATPLTWVYVVTLIALTGAVLIVPWFLPIHVALQVVVLVVGLLVVAWFAKLRGWICARAFARTLLNRDGKPTRLRDVHQKVAHVFCAADLHTGEHVYLSGGFACAYRYGVGSAGNVWLHDAVHASAAYPGGFPARRLPTAPHEFTGAADENAKGTSHMVLVDGGVYDNMADEWALGVRDRNQRWPDHAAFAEPTELVVVNASAAMGWNSLRSLSIPLVGEALTVKRDVDVLYDTTTSTRRRWLVDRFENDIGRMRGALVHIAQSPFRVPQLIVESLPPADERVARARAVLAALGTSEARWREVVTTTRGVKTTLSKLGEESSARLVEHGYVLALANLHVHLGYPLLEVPAPERFNALVRGEKTS